MRVTNPGIPVPTGSNAHLLSNSVTAGTNPSWVTGTTIFYNVGAATNITLLATDTEASDIDYTLVSGTLPTGLTLDNETGVISGTFSGSASEGAVTSITIRATDAGGNFLDRTFSLTANAAPSWTTPVGALSSQPGPGTPYSFQLVASGGSAGGALTYTIQSGSLNNGLTLSSSGLISGTTNDVAGTTATFTVRVTDQAGLFADRTFTTTTKLPLLATGGTVTTNGNYRIHRFTSSDTFTITQGSGTVSAVIVGAGGCGGSYQSYGSGSGGGGAGGVRHVTGISASSGNSFTVTVAPPTTGGGSTYGGRGASSFFGTHEAHGGGNGGWPDLSAAGNGGSGGGASGGVARTSSRGTATGVGVGNNGGQGGDNGTSSGGGGGGGYSSAGGNGSGSAAGSGGAGVNLNSFNPILPSVELAGGGGGGGTSNPSNNGNASFGGSGYNTGSATPNTGGGGAGESGNGAGSNGNKTGASGVVYVYYESV